ncbi:MAG: cell division protein FtsA [Ardenticatenales bacterium]|nr:cell division protein FtsA [Ardenticatenales bacterium]
MGIVVTGLDIGTTKIACLVGELDDQHRMRIIGVGIVPSKGIKKGVIVNVDEATEAIQRAVEKAERTSGQQIREAYVGVAGSHISAVNSRGTVAINRPSHHIEPDDVRRALEAARTIAIPHSQEVIHVVPRGYWLDGSNGVRNPVGLHGYRLEVEAHVVTAAATALQTYEKCCEGAGVAVRAFVLEPLASGEAVLHEDEKELGVVLVDIGGGTTDISVFLESSVWHTVSLPVGGHHLTHDLAVGLQCPLGVAEEIKKRFGYAAVRGVVDDSFIDISHFGDEPFRDVSRRDVAEILEHRVLDIFDLILREMKRSGYDGLLPAGLVFCGGSSQLAGLKEAGRDFFSLPVRVAAPQGLSGLVDVLGNPAYATSVGLLEWGLHQDQIQGRMKRAPGGESASSQWVSRIREWLATLLPG